jgi:phosphoribosylglycinamide formyltransferase 2
VQVDGDYRESWQPHVMDPVPLAAAQHMARQVTDALDGWGIFGVELFVRGDEVLFSEVSPRPHDTGMVTMVSQPQSEFALHVRAILGLPVDDHDVELLAPASASAVILATTTVEAPTYGGLEDALAVPTAQVRIFRKPDTRPGRRMGVALATGATIAEARTRATEAAGRVTVS